MYQPPGLGPGMPGTPRRSPVEVGAWLVVALPLVLGVFMFIVTPTYFRPMLHNALGWMLLALVVVLEAAAFGAVRWGIRRFGAGSARLRLFMLLVMVGLIFPSLWIVLLGPAVMVIMTARGGG